MDDSLCHTFIFVFVFCILMAEPDKAKQHKFNDEMYVIFSLHSVNYAQQEVFKIKCYRYSQNLQVTSCTNTLYHLRSAEEIKEVKFAYIWENKDTHWIKTSKLNYVNYVNKYLDPPYSHRNLLNSFWMGTDRRSSRQIRHKEAYLQHMQFTQRQHKYASKLRYLCQFWNQCIKLRLQVTTAGGTQIEHPNCSAQEQERS
jgi:hypothetical protein